MKPDSALRAALYARVSTRDKGQEVDNQLIKLRRFDVVVFWALDRLTQEGALATLEYLNQLSRYGVAFRSYMEPYLDSCGVFKGAIIAILGTIARQERLRLSERVRAGLERARRLRAQGWSWGRIARALGVSKAAVRRACQNQGKPGEVCQ